MNSAFMSIPLQQWGGDAPVEFDTPLTIGLMLVFFALMIGIGLAASRYQGDEEDYFAGGRRSGTFVIALSGFAAIQSGWGLVGGNGTTYLSVEYLAVSMIIPFAFILAYWLLAKKMRLLGTFKNAITAPDAMYYRFGKDENVRMLGAIAVVLGSMGYLASQYAALGIIGAVVLPVDFFGALIIGLVVIGIYTTIGGILAAMWSDAIQGTMMIIGGFLVFYYVVTGFDGGIGEMASTLQAEAPSAIEFTTMGGDGLFQVGFFFSIVFIALTIVGQPQLTTRFYMIRDISLLKWGAFISGFGYFATTFYWWAGPILRAAVVRGDVAAPGNPDSALPIALVTWAPEWVVAFVLTGVVAAIMSTSNAFLNLAASAIQHDMIQEYGGRDLTNAQQVQYGRIVTVVVLVAAFAIAATFPGLIFVLGAAGWALFASVLVPGVAIAYNWKGATKEGIIAGGGFALVGTLVLAYAPQYLDFSLPYQILGGQLAGFLGIVIFVVVSLVTSTAEFDDLNDEDVKTIISTGRISTRAQDTPAPQPTDDD